MSNDELFELVKELQDDLVAYATGGSGNAERYMQLRRILRRQQICEMPLLVRRSGAGRGQLIRHVSGRGLVPADNSPAHWSLSLALQSEVPTLGDIRTLLERDLIPIAMILSRKEREQATYRCTRSAVSLNELGRKVAHIEDVALGRGELETMPIASLRSHFLRFMMPSNMFVMPLEWAGLAELPRVIESIKAVDGY